MVSEERGKTPSFSRNVDLPDPGRPTISTIRCFTPLSEDLLRHYAGDVGQPEVAATEAVGQLLVIEAEQVENRGVEIVNVHPVLHRVIADIIGRSVNEARLDAAPGHPDRVAVRIVIASIITL